MNKILTFCNKHFALVLIVVVLISYGQLLKMATWEDDQALFFKLAHINEAAGYFGAGPLGSGVYRFSATPFIPIYTLFGFNTTIFFAFLIILYIIATLIVYKTFSLILGDVGGKIAGFLYAAGYIASESIIRMNNSATTSISIILSSLILACLWKFYKQNRYIWYIPAVALYGVAVLVSYARIHYFIVVIILFELIFLTFKKPIRSIIYSLIRLIPFIFIFYNNYLIDTDSRAGEVHNFLVSLSHGQFYLLYGFLASLAYLVVPDWFIDMILRLSPLSITIALVLFSTGMTVVCLWNNIRLRFLILILVPTLITWIVFSNNIFNTPLLRTDQQHLFVVNLGGIIILLSILIFIIAGKHRKLYTFLLFWLFGNLAAYSAYLPTYAFDTVDRYTAHSFLALAGIAGLLYVVLPKDRLVGKIGVAIIVLLAAGNIYHSLTYQHNILQIRSYPSKRFYTQLKNFLPKIEKDDIIYIDVAPEAQNIYNANISAAMMPDTTAFAWRYGVDRYDFKLTSDFDELIKIITSDKIPPTKVHTFWYSKDGLTDTTKDITAFLSNNFQSDALITNLPQVSHTTLNTEPQGTSFTQPDTVINITNSIRSALPSVLSLYISATPADTSNISFPLINRDDSTIKKSPFFNNLALGRFAFDYQKEKLAFYKTAQFETSSQWQSRIGKNVSDQNPTTIWQADRILWNSDKAFIKIKLGSPMEIDRIAWINGFANNTPTEYTIETSVDGNNWTNVKNTTLIRRLGTAETQTEKFSPIWAQFIRINFVKTIDGDSPSIAELWVIPAKFKDLDIKETDVFLDSPFAYITSSETFNYTLTQMNVRGRAKVYWEGNRESIRQSSSNTEFDLIYDGSIYEYKIPLPAGGTFINKVILSNLNIPGKITVENIKIKYPTLMYNKDL